MTIRLEMWCGTLAYETVPFSRTRLPYVTRTHTIVRRTYRTPKGGLQALAYWTRAHGGAIRTYPNPYARTTAYGVDLILLGMTKTDEGDIS